MLLASAPPKCEGFNDPQMGDFIWAGVLHRVLTGLGWESTVGHLLTVPKTMRGMIQIYREARQAHVVSLPPEMLQTQSASDVAGSSRMVSQAAGY